MVSDTQKTTDELSLLVQERDVFKRQFLRIQENYENKIKELSILKELGNSLRATNFYDKKASFWNQLKIIKKYIRVMITEKINSNKNSSSLDISKRLSPDDRANSLPRSAILLSQFLHTCAVLEPEPNIYYVFFAQAVHVMKIAEIVMVLDPVSVPNLLACACTS